MRAQWGVLFGVLCVLPALGQNFNKFANAGADGSGAVPCQTENFPDDAVCSTGDWRIPTSGPLDFTGGASSHTHAEYGKLTAAGNAQVTTCCAAAAGEASSGAGGQANFVDELHFVGLTGTGPFFLRLTLEVAGVVGGG